jgi:hypothetical protein
MSSRNKRICWSCLCLFVLGVSIVWILTSCRTGGKFDELKDIPVTVFATDDRKDSITRADIGYHFNHQRGYNYIELEVPRDIRVIQLDSRYREVDYWWVLKFNNWFKKLQHENGILPIDQDQNHDCDNFAMLYKSLMSIASYKGGHKDEPACAVLVVRQVEEFGGIPGTGGLHMVNLVFTNQGWFIIEPQTNKRVLLENYPNEKYVQYLIF